MCLLKRIQAYQYAEARSLGRFLLAVLMCRINYWRYCSLYKMQIR